MLEWNRRATELEPDFPYWWVRLGIRQMIYGDLVEARESFEEAIRLQPYHPVALQMLRILSEQTGDDTLREFVDQRLAELGAIDGHSSILLVDRRSNARSFGRTLLLLVEHLTGQCL